MADGIEHPTREGKVYLAVVLEAFSRLVVGWSIADRVRTELVVDADVRSAWRLVVEVASSAAWDQPLGVGWLSKRSRVHTANKRLPHGQT